MRQVEEAWFSENILLRGLNLDIGKLSHIKLIVAFKFLDKVIFLLELQNIYTVLSDFSFSCLSSGANLKKINEKSSLTSYH